MKIQNDIESAEIVEEDNRSIDEIIASICATAFKLDLAIARAERETIPGSDGVYYDPNGLCGMVAWR